MKHDYTDGGCPYKRCRCTSCGFWRRRQQEREAAEWLEKNKGMPISQRERRP